MRLLSLAMCLAVRPQYLFLDEPFTGLDTASKSKLFGHFESIWRAHQQVIDGELPLKSIVLVSHDLDDVAAIADTVFVFPRRRPISTWTQLPNARPAGTAPSPEERLAMRADLQKAYLEATGD